LDQGLSTDLFRHERFDVIITMVIAVYLYNVPNPIPFGRELEWLLSKTGFSGLQNLRNQFFSHQWPKSKPREPLKVMDRRGFLPESIQMIIVTRSGNLYNFLKSKI
jgi:hypothetical protein